MSSELERYAMEEMRVLVEEARKVSHAPTVAVDLNERIASSVNALVRLYDGECRSLSAWSSDRVLELFSRVSRFLPVTPLTGGPEEWRMAALKRGECWVNKRCRRVMKSQLEVLVDGEDEPVKVEVAWDCRFYQLKDRLTGTEWFAHGVVSFPYTPGDSVVIDVGPGEKGLGESDDEAIRRAGHQPLSDVVTRRAEEVVSSKGLAPNPGVSV